MNQIKKCIYNNIIPFIGSFFQRRNNYINVIYYHDVVENQGFSFMKININVFKKQMQYLKENGYVSKTFDELKEIEDCRWDEKTVLITFDDGWLSNYTEIFDFMKSLNIKYNIFLEVGKISVDPNYLTWEQVKEMYGSGIVGFGAHTFSHPDMSDVSALDLTHEIDDANKKIKEELGFNPNDFCFPFGAYSDKSLQTIIDRKTYKRIYTSDLNYSYIKDGTLIFGRNAISNDEGFNVFVNKLKGRYNIFSLLNHLILRK